MKRRTIEHGAFSIMLLLAVSLVAFALPALAQTNVSIGSATVDVDGETTLPIVINNVNDPDGVGTADIKLSFDSDVVHVTASTAGDFDSITPNFAHNESGADSYVTFLAYQVASSGLTSGAIVTTITLKAVGTAGQESPLDITITTLADNTPDGNDIPADDADGTFTVGGAAAPTLVSYTISNTTIIPPQTTSIDVKFSEQVSAIIKIEDASGNLVNELYTSTGVTDPEPKIWNGTYTNGTTVPNGTYTVNVSGVSTATGLSVVDISKTITVGAAANQPPTAVIASPTDSGTYREGTEVSFLSTGSTDPDGTIVSYNWTFGDGNTSTLANTTHIYATADTYTVTLTVTDDNGATNSTTVTVTVSPAIAQINSWTLPSTGTRGTSISATVTIENTGTETIWFVVSISGTQDTTGYPIVSTGTVRLDAGESVDAPVMITVPGSADTGSYTLTPVVYKLDDYPAGDMQAIGSGKSVTIS